MEGFHQWGVPQNGWFNGKSHLEMDDLKNTPISGNHHITISNGLNIGNHMPSPLLHPFVAPQLLHGAPGCDPPAVPRPPAIAGVVSVRPARSSARRRSPRELTKVVIQSFNLPKD